MSLEHDLAELAERADALGGLRGAAASLSDLPGPTRERIEDALRPGSVRDVRGAAASAGSGEPGRRAFRAVSRAWLDVAASEPSAELERRQPEVPTFAEIERDPELRRRQYARRVEELARLEGLRAERADARLEGARRAGADSIASYLGAEHPVPPARTRDTFGAGAILPLDDAVAAAARDRRRGSRVPLLRESHAADVVLLRELDGLGARYGVGDAAKVVETLAGGLGLGVDLDQAPRWLTPAASRDRGAPPVGALRRSLAALGRATRAGFLDRTRGTAARRFADPAYEHAAAVLFRRLALNEAFRQRHGPAPEPQLDRALRLEEALAPREAWTYLDLVLRRAQDETRTALGDPAVIEAFERATGEPPSADEELFVQEADPRGAGVLRGVAYALLLEERLMLRFGRAWFERRPAAALLREIWEAEPDTDAENMAVEAGLGTIESTPIVDRCAP